jgi:hypothetical protein
MSILSLALLWATPFMGLCLVLGVLLIAADYQSSRGD